MELKNAIGWEKTRAANTDSYGGGVIAFAERWADLMEKKIAGGENLADIAKMTSHEADADGITGFMYGCAVSILAQVWRHGEALRRWHNLDTQIKDEGEKANLSGGMLKSSVAQHSLTRRPRRCIQWALAVGRGDGVDDFDQRSCRPLRNRRGHTR